MDPFVVLGVPVTMDLDEAEVERRYLELSRESHPDHNSSAAPEEQIAVLERSARLNDAYRVLRDPWRRAAAILELRHPGVLDGNKQLSPGFLMEAMELSEEVAQASAESAGPLRSRIEAQIAEDLSTLRASIEKGEWDEAATLLHQSRYHRKALEDLKAAA